MSFLLCFSIIPALLPCFLPIRFGDLGCAVCLSGAAGASVGLALSALDCRSLWLGLIFLPAALAFPLSLSLSEPIRTDWRGEWQLRARRLFRAVLPLAFACGICHHSGSVVALCAAYSVMLRLSGRRLSALSACAVLTCLLCGWALPFSGALSPAAGVIACGIALSASVFELIPAAETICSGLQNSSIYCLFVFSTYYYTISIF